MYKVINPFFDLEDGKGANYQYYNVGDTYPRAGFKASDERIAKLASEDNALGIPLIEEVEEPKAKKTTKKEEK